MTRVAVSLLTIAAAACVKHTIPSPNKSLYADKLGCAVAPAAPATAPSSAPSSAPPPDAARVTIGVGSVVHKNDATTDSFLVYESLRSLKLAETVADVKLVDHPGDARYSITGFVHGPLRYERRESSMSKASPKRLVPITLGYTLGSSFTTLGLVGAAVDHDGLQSMAIPGILLLAVGLTSHITWWTSKANHYDYAQRVDLVLRRDGEPIGHFSSANAGHFDSWKVNPTVRQQALAAPLRQLRSEIARCIDADLRQREIADAR